MLPLTTSIGIIFVFTFYYIFIIIFNSCAKLTLKKVSLCKNHKQFYITAINICCYSETLFSLLPEKKNYFIFILRIKKV